MAKADRYNWGSKALHWTIVALLLVQFVLILTRHFLRNAEAQEVFLELQLIQIHKSVGLTILALAPVRLLWRWIGGLPEWAPGTAPWEEKAFHGVESALYALLFFVPIAGTASTLAAGQPLLWFDREIIPALLSPMPWLSALALTLHALLIYALVGFFALHLGLVFRRTLFEGTAHHRRIFF